MIRRYLPKSVEDLVHWYERYISPLSLVAGFLADNFILLRRVDLLRSNLLLFSYLAIAALGIILINLLQTGRLRAKWMQSVAPLIPVVVQFSIGGLFSGYLSLYSRSAAFPLSWVFVLIVAGLLLGNERFTRLYVQFTFQIALYFTVLFSFFIFFLPVVFKAIGPYMFVAAGLTSVAVITILLRFIAFLMPEIVRRDRTRIARSIAIIFVVFNVLYFTDMIPPLPLALKDGGVYHAVTKTQDGQYLLAGEETPWYESFLMYNTQFHQSPNDDVFVWSAIFAPSGLSTVILHEWQHYDPGSGAWITMDTLRFPIVGGRDGGYRGFTNKSGLLEGRWRVNVVTEYGQLIGRISFTVIDVATTSPETETVR